ncbi:MAG: F0F1 ATP synthase subunit alpha, partial [Nitrospirota bacterium]
RLDLAQYRELAAFAQFASDLDKATRAQLERGIRMVELLKQDQYIPMPVDEQIMLIFAGTEGHLDDLPVGSIRAFEDGFLRYYRAEKQDLKKELKEKRIIDEGLKPKMTEAITTFKSTFKAQIGS